MASWKSQPVVGLFGGLVLAMAGLTVLAASNAQAPTALSSAGTPLVTAQGPTVVEHAGPAAFRVRVKKPARRAIRVDFRTQADSAHAGSDFVAKSGHVTIRKHQKSAKIAVRVVDDSTHEGTERFYVKLSSKTARLKHQRVTVTVLDDDPAAPSPKLTGTITFHLKSDTYFAQLQLPTPGNESWDQTFTLHVSLVQTADGTWVDDGTGDWAFGSTNDFWFRRGEGADSQENGFPFGCADNPITFNFYKREYWYDSAGHNAGPLLPPPSQFAVPDLHQAFLTLTGYHPDATGSPVLHVVAHLRPDHFETRIPDADHVCDPDTVQQPNPIVHEGADDPYLDGLESSAYQLRIPRVSDPGGLIATYDGSGLDFADGATLDSHTGFFNDSTGHWSTETSDLYSVTGSLTLG
jgi:hypothetical protein